MKQIAEFIRGRIRFDRNEVSGAFGDMGTSLPLLIAVVAASGINGPKVFLIFGLMQIVSGLIYGVPMSVQPLKAVAMIVIARNLSGSMIFAAGFAIGVVMLVLTLSGALEKLGKIIPETVIRGIQFGLGLQLATTALKTYIPSAGVPGYVLALTGGIIGFALLGNRKYPPALFLIAIGVIYPLFSKTVMHTSPGTFLDTPVFQMHQAADIIAGFLILTLPQIPLSVGNSIFATEKISNDCFPDKKITVRKIGLTYALMNLASSFLGGMPVCHGSGGMAGHYAFGARTGGSVVIAGLIMAAAGIFGGSVISVLITGFPQPILGTILVFEAIALMSLVRKQAAVKEDFYVIIFTGILAATLPYGYVIAMISGSVLHNYYLAKRRQCDEC